MAIDCDLRIATNDSRFGITPSKLGIVYPSASLERATHLLGPAVTKRMLFTGDLITAGEARHIGLVDEIVDAADGDRRLATLTGVLAARSLLTQAATKSMVASSRGSWSGSTGCAELLERHRRTGARRCRRHCRVRREACSPVHVVRPRWRLERAAVSSDHFRGPR